MKISCNKCRREIDFNPFKASEIEKSLSCKFCGASFTLRPRVGMDGFDVIFDEGKKTVRNCINCAKKFYCSPSEPIPVCPACQNAPALKEKPVNKYFIIKDTGKRLGPYTLEDVGSWINEGLLGENDFIETPEGERERALKIPELNPYIKDYYSKTKKIPQPQTKRQFQKTFSFNVPVKKILLLFFAIVLFLWGYLVLKGTGNDNAKLDEINILMEQWGNRFTNIQGEPDYYHRAAVTDLNSYTLRSCTRARDGFIRAFLKSRGEPSRLPFISLALSCIYSFTGDSKTANVAIEVSRPAIKYKPEYELGYIAQGEIYSRLGKIEDARLLLEKAVALKPDSGFAMLYLGKTLLENPSKRDAGIAYLEKAILNDPSLSYAHFLLGLEAFKNGRFGEALSEFNKRLEKSGFDPESLYYRASVNILLRKFVEARADLIKSLKADPESHKGRLLLSQIQYRIFRQFAETRRNLEILLHENSSVPPSIETDARLLSANLYLTNNKFEDAITQINRGLVIKPTDRFLKLAKMNALLSLKRKSEALPIIQEFSVGDIPPSDDISLYLLLTYEKFGLFSESMDVLLRYVSAEPKFMYPFLKLASIYLQRKEGEKAKSTLLLGMDKTVLFQNADFLIDLRSPILSINIKELGDDLKRNSKNLMNPDLVETAILIAMLQGDTSRLEPADLKRIERGLLGVLARDKNITHSYIGLAYINLLTSNLRQSEEYLKKALEMDIKSSSALLLQGILYGRRKDAGNARAKLKEAQEYEGLKFLATCEMGNVESALGNKDDAYSMFLACRKARPDFYPAISKMADLERRK